MISKSSDLKDRINKALTSQKRTKTVLSSLLAIEHELGYIPEEAIEETAAFTNTTINDVWGVASFYTNFQFQAPGKHKIEVCWGPPCHILGAMPIIEELLDCLRISKEGNTDDDLVTFRYNTCLGACAKGPVISVDHKLVGEVTPEKIKNIIGEIKDRSNGI